MGKCQKNYILIGFGRGVVIFKFFGVEINNFSAGDSPFFTVGAIRPIKFFVIIFNPFFHDWMEEV
jgi:hypothetical protein